MQFGDVDTIGDEPVADFIGNDDNKISSTMLSESPKIGHFDSRDHELNRFFHAYSRSDDPKDGERLINEIKDRLYHQSNFQQIVTIVTKNNDIHQLMNKNTYSFTKYFPKDFDFE